MNSWLPINISDSFHSTIGQIRDITKDFVDDIIQPSDDAKSNYRNDQFQTKIKALEKQIEILQKQQNSEIEYVVKATIEELVDNACLLHYEGQSKRCELQFSHIKMLMRHGLNDISRRLDILLELNAATIIESIVDSYWQNPEELEMEMFLKDNLKSFPMICSLLTVLNHNITLCRKQTGKLKMTQSQNQLLCEEVNRLKGHLVDIHEQHDFELNKTLHHCNDLSSQNDKLKKENNDLVSKMIELFEDRDRSFTDLKQLKTKSEHIENDLNIKLSEQSQVCMNLQNALTQSYNETRNIIRELKEGHKQELLEMKDEISHLKQNNHVHHQQVDNTNISQDNQVQQLKRSLRSMKIELNIKEQERNAFEQTLKNISPTYGNRIEKSLARELLLSFLRISEDKREQAIKPLAQILEFTDRQVDEVISLSKSSWFTNRMSLPSHVESKQNSGQSLAELLIKYMDKETRPDMHVKFHNDVKRMQSD